MAHFEYIGWFKDYYLDGKYMGSVNIEHPDREVTGYNGRMVEVIQQTIKTNTKKTLKVGMVVKTEIYPLCGKMLK